MIYKGDSMMGNTKEGRASALLPILVFLLIFLGSGFITGDFYSMPAIAAFFAQRIKRKGVYL